MQIKVNQKEIEAGVAAFLKSQGVNVEGQTVSMTFTAGRKGNGLTADVSIGEMSDTPESEKGGELGDDPIKGNVTPITEDELPEVTKPGGDDDLFGKDTEE